MHTKEKPPVTPADIQAVLEAAVVAGGDMTQHFIALYETYGVRLSDRGTANAIGAHPGYRAVEEAGTPVRIEGTTSGERPTFVTAALFAKDGQEGNTFLVQYALSK